MLQKTAKLMTLNFSFFKKLFLFTLLFFCTQVVFAQSLTNYTFTSNTNTSYSAISGGTNLNSNLSNNTSFGGNSIGFDFWFMGVKYTHFAVSTNGFIVLGGSSVSISSNFSGNTSNYGASNGFSSNNVQAFPVLAPLWDDLGGASSAPNASSLSYLTNGVAPNRVLTIQWRNATWGDAIVSFQIKLTETSGAVTYHYSTSSTFNTKGTRSATVGMATSVSELINLRSTNTTNGANLSSSNNTNNTSNTSYNEVGRLNNSTNVVKTYTPSSSVSAPTGVTATALSSGSIRLNWSNVTSNAGYRIERSLFSNFNEFVVVADVAKNNVTYTDSDVSPNTKYFYRLRTIREIVGATASSSVNATTFCATTYPAGVNFNYRFDGNARDELGLNNGSFNGIEPQLVTDRHGNENSAYQFNGTTNVMTTSRQFDNPSDFTISIWFKTSSNRGGKLISFGNAATGDSYSHDRHIYMGTNGYLYFGVYPSVVRVINSNGSFNNGAWHHIAATLSPTNGMALYLDGVLVSSNSTVKSAENYKGYWRVGGDRMDNSWTGWTSGTVANAYFPGTLDDVVIYERALSAEEIFKLSEPQLTARNSGPVCAGSTFQLFVSDLGAGTYTWSGPNGFSSTLKNPPAIELTSATTGIYEVTFNNGSCSTKTTTTVFAKDNDPGLWAGKKDEDWTNKDNWCACEVPTNTVDVKIPTSGPTYNPNLNAVGKSKNITIESGRMLTIGSSGEFQISGFLTSNNNLNGQAGAVVFNGTAAQTIPANAFFENRIRNLTVSNSSGVTLGGRLDLTGVLAVNSGIFQVGDDRLVLVASEQNFASVAAIPSNSSVRGRVKVQTFLKGGTQAPYRSYRMLSSPVYDNSTTFITSVTEGSRKVSFNQLKDDMIITGSGGNANGFDFNNTSAASAWTYGANGYVAIPRINTDVNIGSGMYVYYRGNRSNDVAKITPPYVDVEDNIVDFDGILNQQDVLVSLNYSATGNRYNFLGNPYASTIDWESSGIEKVNVGTTIWVWNVANRNYATYVVGAGGNAGIGVNGGSRYILPGKGFFVQSTGSGSSVRFKEGSKITPQANVSNAMASANNISLDFATISSTKDRIMEASSNQTYLVTKPGNVLRIKAKTLDSYGEDETILVFNDNGSRKSTIADAIHMDGERLNLSSLSADGIKLAVSFEPAVKDSLSIPLVIGAAASGSYLLQFNTDEFLDVDRLKLKDNYAGVITTLYSNMAYQFSVDLADKRSFGSERFSIIVEKLEVLPLVEKSFQAKQLGKDIKLVWRMSTNVGIDKFQLFKLGANGQFMFLGDIKASNSENYSFIDYNASVGENYYKLVRTVKTGTVSELATTSAKLILASNAAGVKIYPNPFTVQTTIRDQSIKSGNYDLVVHDVVGKTVLKLTVTGNELNEGFSLESNGFKNGTYFIKVVDSKKGVSVLTEKIIKQNN